MYRKDVLVMGEELIPDGLRKLTEKVYDVLVPGGR
nr:MAG TPA: Protein PMT-2 transferase, transferase [Caudoviricetes sp.]